MFSASKESMRRFADLVRYRRHGQITVENAARHLIAGPYAGSG
jgi:hypothetical protein